MPGEAWAFFVCATFFRDCYRTELGTLPYRMKFGTHEAASYM
jgi:hypothetical protein